MATTLLERTRASHEDIERFERAIVKVLLEDAKTVLYPSRLQSLCPLLDSYPYSFYSFSSWILMY